MDFSGEMDIIRTVLGDSYIVLDVYDALDESFTLRIDRKGTTWHLKMRFSRYDLITMGDSFAGAVCRQVVGEYSNFIMRSTPE